VASNSIGNGNGNGAAHAATTPRRAPSKAYQPTRSIPTPYIVKYNPQSPRRKPWTITPQPQTINVNLNP